MNYSPILAPVVALVAWSILICFWMLITRFAEFKRLGITPEKIPDGARGVDLEGKAAPAAQWKSHNYNHLMEQPTIFYAIALTLALMNFGNGINYWLAWAFVGLRIVHSLIQCTVNVVRLRLVVFMLATLCLIGLTTHAGLRILHDCGLINF
jgi:hypothetical protein